MKIRVRAKLQLTAVHLRSQSFAADQELELYPILSCRSCRSNVLDSVTATRTPCLLARIYHPFHPFHRIHHLLERLLISGTILPPCAKTSYLLHDRNT